MLRVVCEVWFSSSTPFLESLALSVVCCYKACRLVKCSVDLDFGFIFSIQPREEWIMLALWVICRLEREGALRNELEREYVEGHGKHHIVVLIRCGE